MKMVPLAALAAGLLAAAPATAETVLTTGTGDGQVSVTVSNQGAFSEAFYNPVGAQLAADAVASSYAHYRVDGGGAGSGLFGDGAFTSVTGTRAVSRFIDGGFQFDLVQTLTSLLDASGAQTGSQLAQAYTITNLGDAAAGLTLSRYIDGDLVFQSNSFRDDGGGILMAGGNPILFETDRATGANDQSSFVGISNEGGTDGRYDIDEFSALDGRIRNGLNLRNQITGDGNGDGFIDAGPGYDVGLALSRRFTLGAFGSVTYTTNTIFGTGAPAAVAGDVPEPATWGTMLLGFGVVGAAMRRRRRAVVTA